MAATIVPPAAFDGVSAANVNPPVTTGAESIWSAAGLGVPASNTTTDYFNALPQTPDGDALRAVATMPDFMGQLDSASDAIIAHRQNALPDVSQAPAVAGTVPPDWRYDGGFRMPNADTGPTNTELQSNLHDQPVTVEPQVAPQGFGYSREYVLGASVGDQELYIHVTVDSGVDVVNDTEAGTLTTQVWKKSGGVFVFDTPESTQPFTRGTREPATGAQSYLGLPQQGCRSSHNVRRFGSLNPWMN